MQSDGAFSATAAFDGRHRQFAITYQATPWLEGTFRYTGFDQFFYWDRNYEFKARLWEEELYLPALAEKEVYTILPTTYEPERLGPFFVTVKADCDFRLSTK